MPFVAVHKAPASLGLQSRGPCNAISSCWAWLLVPPSYAVHWQEQVNQPEKSLTARVIGPPPALAFPLLSCRHKAVVPRGSCQPQQPQHKPRLFFWKRFGLFGPATGRKLFRTRLCLSLCPSFQPHLSAFSWLCSLLERSRVDEWGLPCARDVILTLSAPKNQYSFWVSVKSVYRLPSEQPHQ